LRRRHRQQQQQQQQDFFEFLALLPLLYAARCTGSACMPWQRAVARRGILKNEFKLSPRPKYAAQTAAPTIQTASLDSVQEIGFKIQTAGNRL
jgi:hypothetical protein